LVNKINQFIATAISHVNFWHRGSFDTCLSRCRTDSRCVYQLVSGTAWRYTAYRQSHRTYSSQQSCATEFPTFAFHAQSQAVAVTNRQILSSKTYKLRCTAVAEPDQHWRLFDS